METKTGKILTTAAAITTGVLVAIKNHKKKGFWYGVGAMVLIGLTIKTYKPAK